MMNLALLQELKRTIVVIIVTTVIIVIVILIIIIIITIFKIIWFIFLCIYKLFGCNSVNQTMYGN